MEHNHHNSHIANLKNSFKVGITINIVFIILEAFYGFLSNSMALIADAGHNLSDVLTLTFAWIAVILSQKKPTMVFTYGLRRSTILVALLNTVLLLVAVSFIIWEAIQRIGQPLEINSQSVIVIASIGILINGFTAWLFTKGQKNDINIRSAFIHFIADALVSLGVVVSGIIIFYTNITWIDTLISIAIVFVILYGSIGLLKKSLNLALDAVPENINIENIKKYLNELPEVIDIHDLHIWALSTTETALTVHLTTNVQTNKNFLLNIQNHLNNNFKIEHSTIQIEYGYTNSECKINCN